MIDIELSSHHPTMCLRMPAERRSLPMARQAVRSLGEALEADAGSLHEAELAVTRACARAIGDSPSRRRGTVELRLRPHGRMLRAEVGDLGRRISMLVGLGARNGDGIEPPSYARASERAVRRVTAMFAARVELPSDRLMEALLVGELMVRYAPGRLRGGRLTLRLDQHRSGFRFQVGPLAEGGGLLLLRDATVPVVGSVIERLADEVAIHGGHDCAPGAPGAGESLVVAIAK